MADIAERLKFDAARCEVDYSKGIAANIEEAADEIERLRAALGTIDQMCSEEITARFGGHHSKTEEELAGKSAIYSMLVLPRNIARSALALEQKEDVK